MDRLAAHVAAIMENSAAAHAVAIAESSAAADVVEEAKVISVAGAAESVDVVVLRRRCVAKAGATINRARRHVIRMAKVRAVPVPAVPTNSIAGPRVLSSNIWTPMAMARFPDRNSMTSVRRAVLVDPAAVAESSREKNHTNTLSNAPC